MRRSRLHRKLQRWLSVCLFLLCFCFVLFCFVFFCFFVCLFFEPCRSATWPAWCHEKCRNCVDSVPAVERVCCEDGTLCRSLDWDRLLGEPPVPLLNAALRKMRAASRPANWQDATPTQRRMIVYYAVRNVCQVCFTKPALFQIFSEDRVGHGDHDRMTMPVCIRQRVKSHFV